jgi:DNA-directed RNA polymerase
MNLAQIILIILSLPHPTLYDSKAYALGISTSNTTRINRNVVETELDLPLVREFLHLTLNGIQDISVKSSVLKIMVIDNLLVVLAIGENTEELFQVDIVYITGAYPSPGAEIYVKTWRTGTAAQLGDSFQMSGIALL